MFARFSRHPENKGDKKTYRLGVVGEAVVHSRSPTDSLCLEDAELPYDQVGYNLYFSSFCFCWIRHPAVLRIGDVYPGSATLLDPGSKTATKERGEKKFVVLPFL